MSLGGILGGPSLVAAAVLTAAVAVAACSSPSIGPAEPSAGATAGPTASVVDAASLEKALKAVVAETATPSAIVVLRSGRFGDATYTFGTTQLGGSQPVSTRDHVRAGSVTKTMTATVILQLVQEGRLGLDDPVSRYVTGVPNGDAITIAQLLDMRSGLYNYAEDEQWSLAVDAEPQRVWTPQETLAFGFAHPAYFAPGTGYHYSNTNYLLLGLVMEKVTAQTATQLFADRLFAPLGMKNTTLSALADASIPTPFVHGYHFGSFDSALPPDQQAQARAGTLKPEDVSEINPSWAWTAGSVISTADDLVIWSRALVTGSSLSPAMQQQRLDSIRGLGPDYPKAEGVYGYGYGIDRTGSYYGHGGLINGYNTAMSRDPQTDTTIVVVATLTLAPDGTPVAPALANAVKAALADHRTPAGTPSGPPIALSPEETSSP